MPTITRLRPPLLLALILLVVGTLAGCGTAKTQNASCPAPDGLVLVVGVHQNIQAPGIPESVGCTLQSTIAAKKPVVFIAVDGTPRMVLATTFPVTDVNPDAHAADLNAAAATVVNAVTSATPKSNGSNILAGISMGADEAKAQGAPNAAIVVIDSGLSDTGALDMTTPGMLAAQPDQVAWFLATHNNLPDLAGHTVNLVGFGYTTTPQTPVSQAAQTNTIAIWTALLQKAGSTVTTTPAVRTGEGPTTSFTTRTVAAPEETPMAFASTTTVYDDAGSLGFQSNSNDLRDPEAADRTLAPLAGWLVADPARTAHITGTTSSDGTAEGRAQRSLGRAETIKAILISHGAAAHQISVEGAGYTADPPDHTAGGDIDPAAAAQNRTVRITTAS